MVSKWYGKKGEAIKLRRRGCSIRYIEKKLGIPRSTLSGWFRAIQLTPKQKEFLFKKWQGALIKARKKALIWHHAEKAKRLLVAQKEAQRVISSLDLKDPGILDLALAMLYMGEGYKSNDETGLGNSDPRILKFFIRVLKKNYGIATENIRCDLALRADQDPIKMKRFWAQQLELPLENFMHANRDPRTKGSKTYPDYKGVCMVHCGNVAIKRKLLNISREICDRVWADRQ